MREGQVVDTFPLDWSITGLLPADSPRTWRVQLNADRLPDAIDGFAIRVVNPLPNGLPLRFANEYAANVADGWWLLPN
jgi:hypothetical protein